MLKQEDVLFKLNDYRQETVDVEQDMGSFAYAMYRRGWQDGWERGMKQADFESHNHLKLTEGFWEEK